MDEKLLSLLERSRLFLSPSDTFSIKPEVIQLKEFRFWLPNCFYYEHNEDKQASHFEKIMQKFFRSYFNAWAKHMEQTKENFDWKTHAFAITDFFLEFDTKKLLDTVKHGGETANLAVPLTDARFSFRRLGDILAFDISRIRPEKEGHTTGRKIVESLCRDNNDIYELVHSVRASILLPGKRISATSSRLRFDFDSISKDIVEKSLPYADLSLNPISSFIDNYKDINTQGMLIGHYLGLNIRARLVHNDARSKEDVASENSQNRDDAKTWRTGNVEKIDGHNYIFRRGDDLSLVLSLESSLPHSGFYGDVDIDSNLHNEQSKLTIAGAIFLTALCSNRHNAYQEIQMKLHG